MASSSSRTPPNHRHFAPTTRNVTQSHLPQRARLSAGSLSAVHDASSVPIPFNLPPSTHTNPFGARSSPRAGPFSSSIPHRMGTSPANAPGLSASNGALRWTTDEHSQGEPASEWSITGLDVPLRRIRHLLEDEEASDLANVESANATRPFSSLSATHSMVAAYQFGGDARYALEVVRNGGIARAPAPPSESIHDPLLAPQTPALPAPGGLSLFLTYQGGDRGYPIDPSLSVEIMIGVRDKREKRDGWLWRVWDSFDFNSETDFYQLHSMPEPTALIAQSARSISIEHLVLSLQITTVAGDSSAQYRDRYLVPAALMTGLESLFDDPGTGDVLITVCETMNGSTSTPSVDVSDALEGHVPRFRRRVIYAHSALLKARGGYFAAMLGGETWAEAGETVAGRRRHRITLLDFDYSTVYWLLRWLYTNEVRFADEEDARKTMNEELPDGLLSSNANSLGWNWQPLRRAASDVEPRLAYGRVSPVSSQGRVSPVQMRLPTAQERRARGKAVEEPSSPPIKSVPPADPHPHPAPAPEATSALNIYRLAHRCELESLASLALEHLISNLTPKTAFSLLLATELWPELHQAVQQYTLRHWPTILTTEKEELQRCFDEIGQGLWENSGKTLFEFFEARESGGST